MCTLTWGYAAHSNQSEHPSSSGYHIHFNRDESRRRLRALPPQSFRNNNIGYIAPIDQDANGTWIFVNSRGLTACLLNNYAAMGNIAGTKGSSAAIRSRGLLVKDLTDSISVEHAIQRLTSIDISLYAPFDIYLFDKTGVQSLGWDGERQHSSQNPAAPISSSGFDTEAVIAGRARHYQQAINKSANDNALRDFHRSHLPDKSAYSVCMHRNDARTQSYTEISVTGSQASMCYSDGPPCSAPLSDPVAIQLIVN